MEYVNNPSTRAAETLVPISSTPEEQPEAPRKSDFRSFVERAEARHLERAQHPERFQSSWYDPDPKALMALPSGAHPVNRYLLELKQTKRHQAHRRNLIQGILAHLTEINRKDATWDKVLAYPWHQVTPDDAITYYQAICRKFPNRNTQHMYIQILRCIVNRCVRAKVMSRLRAEQILEHLPIKKDRGLPRKVHRLTAAEATALMKAASEDPPFVRRREQAILAVFLTTGMRASELCALELADWDQREEVLQLRETKNGKDREVPVDTRTAAYLRLWLDERGTLPGPLFVRKSSEPDAVGRELDRGFVLGRIQRLARRANVPSLGTHDFRRTVATTLLRTHDAAIVSKLLGHSSLEATLIYDLSGREEQKSAIGSLPLPDITEDESEQSA